MSAENQITLHLQRPAFDLDVDISLPSQGITAVFGASGSGKTSLLRCVAGLERPSPGLVRMGGQIWQDAHTFLPTWRRPLGYVFQEASLLEHLTVQGNLHFGLRRSGQRQTDQTPLQEAIELLGIGHLLKRKVQDLSGGERQRVALARALVTRPRCVLADEPTGNLDRSSAATIFNLMLELRRECGSAIVVVTHDRELAGRMDRCLELRAGVLTPA